MFIWFYQGSGSSELPHNGRETAAQDGADDDAQAAAGVLRTLPHTEAPGMTAGDGAPLLRPQRIHVPK